MSKIDFYKDTTKDTSRKNALQKKIDIVLDKINENDFDIQWYIFDEYNKPNPSVTEKIIKEHFSRIMKDMTLSALLQKDICPGLAEPSSKTIWIYKNVITPTPIIPSCLQDIYDKVNANLYGASINDILANILMDEIAHIKTGKNHGDAVYEDTHKKYLNSFYK